MITLNSNIASYRSNDNMNSIQRLLEQSSARLSSGKRILSAKDDPAGIGIVSTMKAQAMSFASVSKNISAGISLLETSETALKSQTNILQEMRSLAVQASSGTLSSDQREALQKTFSEFQTQLDESVKGAGIFGQNLVSDAAADVSIQSGINAGNTTTLTSAKSDAATLSVASGDIDLGDMTKSSASITALDTAIAKVSENRSILGAQLNGLETMDKNNNQVLINLNSTISRIEDVDVAAETANLNLLQTRMQFAVGMAGVINSMPQMALGLLR